MVVLISTSFQEAQTDISGDIEPLTWLSRSDVLYGPDILKYWGENIKINSFRS